MRSLVMIDDDFVRCEGELMSTTAVGLTDEGVEVVRCVSPALLAESTGKLFEPPLTYQPGVFSITRGLRASHLALSASARYADSGGVDVVHVYGGRLWWLAAAVARRLKCPLIVEVWRHGLASRARDLAARAGVPVTLLAPDPAIERALLQDSAGSAVRLAVWGVHAPSRPAPPVTDGVRSIVLVGPGRDADRAAAAFTAAANIVRRYEDAMVFVDARMARRAGIWALAGRMEVRDRLSLVSELEASRELVTRLDLMVYPEQRGEMRTILLDAMAAGMPLVCCDDTRLACVRDGETARVVPGLSVERWQAALDELIGAPQMAAALGASARAFVREHRRLSSYISSVLDVYEAAGSASTSPAGAAA